MDVLLVLAAVCVVGAFAVSRTSRASRPREDAWPVPQPEPDGETRRTIDELVGGGRTIEAIKVLRASTGLGLREAKERIDTWEPQATPQPEAATSTSPELEALATETRQVRHTSGEIAAVKHVRERTGWGLADAKRYVDRLT